MDFLPFELSLHGFFVSVDAPGLCESARRELKETGGCIVVELLVVELSLSRSTRYRTVFIFLDVAAFGFCFWAVYVIDQLYFFPKYYWRSPLFQRNLFTVLLLRGMMYEAIYLLFPS